MFKRWRSAEGQKAWREIHIFKMQRESVIGECEFTFRLSLKGLSKLRISTHIKTPESKYQSASLLKKVSNIIQKKPWFPNIGLKKRFSIRRSAGTPKLVLERSPISLILVRAPIWERVKKEKKLNNFAPDLYSIVWAPEQAIFLNSLQKKSE